MDIYFLDIIILLHPLRKFLLINIFPLADFHKNVEKQLKKWLLLALNRLLWTEAPLHVLYYERLVQDPFKELTSLLAFLGYHDHFLFVLLLNVSPGLAPPPSF